MLCILLAYLSFRVRYPDGLAWQFNLTKKVLRKSEEFKKFPSFLVFETEVVRMSLYENVVPPMTEKLEKLQGKHIQTGSRQYASPALFGCLTPSQGKLFYFSGISMRNRCNSGHGHVCGTRIKGRH